MPLLPSEKKLFLGLFVTLMALNFLPSGLGDGTGSVHVGSTSMTMLDV